MQEQYLNDCILVYDIMTDADGTKFMRLIDCMDHETGDTCNLYKRMSVKRILKEYKSNGYEIDDSIYAENMGMAAGL